MIYRVLAIPSSLYFSLKEKPIAEKTLRDLSGISWVEMPVDRIKITDPSDAKLDMN